MLGGPSPEKELTSEMDKLLSEDYRDIIEKKAGKKFTVFNPLKYSVQVVAGTIYRCLYEIDDNKYLVAKVFQPLPHTNEEASCLQVQFHDNYIARLADVLTD